MHKVTNKELFYVVVAMLPLIALGSLAGWQLPNYFRISNQLGMHAFLMPHWYSASALIASYGTVGLLSTVVVGFSVTTWLKRRWLSE